MPSTVEAGEMIMASYIIRDIDESLWRKVKSKAAAEGVTTKAIILRLLAAWVR
jgi:hypothetical protein